MLPRAFAASLFLSAFASPVFFGDYSGISAYGGRVIPIFMHFAEERKLAVSVALFRFKLGTQEKMD